MRLSLSTAYFGIGCDVKDVTPSDIKSATIKIPGVGPVPAIDTSPPLSLSSISLMDETGGLGGPLATIFQKLSIEFDT